MEVLTEVPSPRGGSWGPSGTIVFSMVGDSILFRIPETGGEPTPVTVQTPGENSHRYPSFLPDGKHVLYFARNPVSPELGGVWVASLDGNTPPRQLVDAHSLAVYAHPGFLIYRRGENLIAQRFDADALTFTDDPVPIVDDVRELLVSDNTKWGRHVSPDGNLVIFDSMNPMTGDANIGILNRRTGESTLFCDTDAYDWF